MLPLPVVSSRGSLVYCSTCLGATKNAYSRCLIIKVPGPDSDLVYICFNFLDFMGVAPDLHQCEVKIRPKKAFFILEFLPRISTLVNMNGRWDGSVHADQALPSCLALRQATLDKQEDVATQSPVTLLLP